eukprot:scaffold187460_cov35-Tisochrysis_lutea.AAC.4
MSGVDSSSQQKGQRIATYPTTTTHCPALAGPSFNTGPPLPTTTNPSRTNPLTLCFIHQTFQLKARGRTCRTPHTDSCEAVDIFGSLNHTKSIEPRPSLTPTRKCQTASRAAALMTRPGPRSSPSWVGLDGV